MLRRMIDEDPYFRSKYIVCFANTGKERNETLDFLHEIEKRWLVPIVWLEYTRIKASSIRPGVFPTKRRNQNLERSALNGECTHWFRRVDYHSASRKGEPFDELMNWCSVCPNVRARMCSVQLKIRTVMRYLFSLGIKSYAPHIGIRKDEEHRKLEILASCDSFEHPVFPMIDWGETEKDVMKFWSEQPFDLQLQSYEGNCDLCFLKAKWKRIKLIRDNPGMVEWWKNWELAKSLTCHGDGSQFQRGKKNSYAALEEQALSECEIVKDPNDKDIPCSCVEKAFIKDSEDD